MTSHNAPRVVLFDLDNTLFDQDHSLIQAVAAIEADLVNLPLRSGSIDLVALGRECKKSIRPSHDILNGVKLYSAAKTYDKVCRFFETLGMEKPTRDEVDRFRETFENAQKSSYRAVPGAVEVLSRLKQEGYRVAVVTNGKEKAQQAKMEAIGIAHLVEHLVTSQKVGFSKPHPHIFLNALENMVPSSENEKPLKPEDALMVGDKLTTDIEGAVAVGIPAVLFDPQGELAVSEMDMAGSTVTVIRELVQVLDHLGIRRQPRRRLSLVRSRRAGPKCQ